MFETWNFRRNRLPALSASIAVHAIAFCLLWQARQIPHRLHTIQLVHTGTRQPLGLVMPIAGPAKKNWRAPDPGIIPSDLPITPHGDSVFATNVQTVAFDIDPKLETSLSPEIPEEALQTRLREIPQLASEPLDIYVPSAPDYTSGEAKEFGSAIHGNLQPATLLRKMIPAYPSLAMTARIQGLVIIDAVIKESGKLGDFRVVSGHPILIPAALEALTGWQYEPARLNGKATSSEVRINVNFKLRFD